MGLFNLFKGKQDIPPKRDIKDFFSIDINNLFQYNPVYSHTETSPYGNEVKHYTLRLKKLELGIFYEAEILEVAENELNVIFKGRSNLLTKELVEFINFCADCLGLDSSGYGKVEKIDYQHVDAHVFSRMWDKIWIDNMTTPTIIMTIYSLNKSY
ncbi:hypothetical protein [Bacteroides congonensis]